MRWPALRKPVFRNNSGHEKYPCLEQSRPLAGGEGVTMKNLQRDTILAALRIYQQQMELNGGVPPMDVDEIATNSGAHEPMTAKEIDSLCEEINQ